jgi:hypothetical protein
VSQNPRRLLIDDQRYDKEDMFDIPLCDVVVRNPLEGIKALLFLGHFDELYLDHDMGIASPAQVFSDTYEYSGYGVLCFLEANPGLMPSKVILVTSNGSAFVKMSSMLKKYYPVQVGKRFSKE